MGIRLKDDDLEQVAGGVARYSVNEMKQAGVIVSNTNGKRSYAAQLSNGKKIGISESVANGMTDCYQLSGGTKLTDQQINDLIAQS